MTGLTDTAARAALDALVAAYPHVALFTGVGTDAGTGFTEVTAGSYARFDSTGLWAPATGSAPASVTSSTDFAFIQPIADWGLVLALGLYSLEFGGVLGAWDYLGPFSWLPCTVNAGTPATIVTDRTHSLSVGQRCVFTTEYGGNPPDFTQSDLTGVLIVTSAAQTTLAVSNAGIPINTSSQGSGAIRRVSDQTILSGKQFTLNAGTMVVTLA